MSLLRRIRIHRRPSPPHKVLRRSHKHISCPPPIPAPPSDDPASTIGVKCYQHDTAPPQIPPSLPASSSVAEENSRLQFLRTSALVLIIMVTFFSIGKTVSLLLTLAVASACKLLTHLRRDRHSSRSDMEEEDDDDDEEEEEDADDDLYDFTDVAFLRNSRNRNHPRKKLQRLNCIKMKKLPDEEVAEEEDDAPLSPPDISAGWTPIGDGDLSGGAEKCRESTVKKKAMKKNRKLFFKYLQKKEEGGSRSAPSSPPRSPAFMASSSSEPISAVFRPREENPMELSAEKSGVQEKQARNDHDTPESEAKLGFEGKRGRPYERQGKVRAMEEAKEGKAKGGRKKKGKKTVWGMEMVVAGGLCVAMAGLLLGNRIVAIAALSCFWYSPTLIRRRCLFSLSQ